MLSVAGTPQQAAPRSAYYNSCKEILDWYEKACSFISTIGNVRVVDAIQDTLTLEIDSLESSSPVTYTVTMFFKPGTTVLADCKVPAWEEDDIVVSIVLTAAM